MKTFLMIVALVAVVATFTEVAGYSCTDWKKMDGPCTGCVFTSGDMAGKCKMTGQYFAQGTCEDAGGMWCKLELKICFLPIELNKMIVEKSFS